MLMATHLIGFGAGQTSIQQAVAFSGGTNFGNGTIGGGIAAQIDGNTNQAQGSSARNLNDNTLLYAGYTFPAGHVWTGFKAWGSNDEGFFQSSSNNVTVNCYGHTVAPTDTTEAAGGIGTLLGSAGPTADSSSLLMSNLAMANTTSYTVIWITVNASGVAGTNCVAEIQFFETI